MVLSLFPPPSPLLTHSLHTHTHTHTHTHSKQREATKQEALELDEEIERLQSTAQTKLQEEACPCIQDTIHAQYQQGAQGLSIMGRALVFSLGAPNSVIIDTTVAMVIIATSNYGEGYVL